MDESFPAPEEGTDLRSEEVEGLKQAFRRMVEELPEPYREAVRLADLEGVPQTELAERLGISVSGTKSRVQRGRQMLRKELEECCRFEFDRRGKVIDFTPKGECCREE